MHILFNKLYNVKTPDRAYGVADGIDFFVPEYSSSFIQDLKEKNTLEGSYNLVISDNKVSISLNPHSRIIIPSGIRIILGDDNTCLLAVNKSGIAAKKGIVLGACLVDHDYEGEIYINLINTTDKQVEITTGDKIVQFLHLPILHTKLHEINEEDFYKLKRNTSRGVGCFGSSGST